jgi:ribonuclease-3
MLLAVKGLLPKKETLSRERKAQLGAFLKRLSFKFNDFALLDMAFHHRSFSNENQTALNANGAGVYGTARGMPRFNNERLEFLGDTVLGLSVAAFLYRSMPDKTEGELSKIKSVVVSEMTLSQIAFEIGIDSLLILGKGEELSGGRQKKAILADTLEAVIGAVYLDTGFASADKLVLSLITPEVTKVQEKRHQSDYKTLLQEYCQKKYKYYPEYVLLKKTGPDHDRTFVVSVKLSGAEYGPQTGKNKKEAEQAAAKVACEELRISE